MKALAIILLVLFLIAIIPIGASFEYSEEGIILNAHTAFVTIGILPKKESDKPKKPKKEKKPKKKKEEKPQEEKPKVKRGGTVDFILEVLRAVGDTLDRLRRKITINYLVLDYTSAPEDPYDAAMGYGTVSAAMYGVMPLIERAFRVRKKDLRSHFGFSGEGNRIYISAKLTIRIWEIIYIALGMLPAVKAFLVWRKGGKAENNG